MADPEWKSLTPIWHDTVVLLANVIGGHLLDRLLSKRLLTHDQYDSLNSLRKKEGTPKEEVARELLQTLKKSPYPSFDNFWTFLDTEIEGGSDIRRQLFERRDTPPSLLNVDHRRTEPHKKFYKFSEIGGESSRCQQMLLTTSSLPSQSAAADTAAAAVALQPDQRAAVDSEQNAESGQAASKLTVFIEVDESLKDKYRRHAPAIKAVLLQYLSSAYSKNLDKESLLSVDVFCEELSRVKQQEEQEKRAITLSLETDVHPKIRILFPDIDFAKYEPNHDMITTYLCRVMQLKKSDLEIDIAEGSVTLKISIPGRGLINMLIYLEKNDEPLNFLLKVDSLAKISFGEFPYASVSVFGQKDLQKATFEGTAIKMQLSESEGSEFSYLPMKDSSDEMSEPTQLPSLLGKTQLYHDRLLGLDELPDELLQKTSADLKRIRSISEQDLAVARWLMELKDDRKSALLRLCFLPLSILKQKIACELHFGDARRPPRIVLVVSNWRELANEWSRRKGYGSGSTNSFKKAFKSSFTKSKVMRQMVSCFTISQRSGLSRSVTLEVSQHVLPRIQSLQQKDREETLEMRVQKLTTELLSQENVLLKGRAKTRSTQREKESTRLAEQREAAQVEKRTPGSSGKEETWKFFEVDTCSKFFGCEPKEALVGEVTEFVIKSNKQFKDQHYDVALHGEKGGMRSYNVFCNANNNLSFQASWDEAEYVRVTLCFGGVLSSLGTILFKPPPESGSWSTSVSSSSASRMPLEKASLFLPPDEAADVLRQLESGQNLSQGVGSLEPSIGELVHGCVTQKTLTETQDLHY